jgi:SAM-dependent methyltransferase
VKIGLGQLSNYSAVGILRRLWWRIGRSLGGRHAVAVWNDQYSRGIWREFDRGRSPNIVRLISDSGIDLDLVEFGCGEGSLPFAVGQGVIRTYRGFDISSIAVANANHHFARSGMDFCSASHADLASLSELDACDLILAAECLYYLSSQELQRLLEVAWPAIRPGGGLIAVVCDGEKHGWVLDQIRAFSAQCEVRDYTYGSRSVVMLVKACSEDLEACESVEGLTMP